MGFDSEPQPNKNKVPATRQKLRMRVLRHESKTLIIVLDLSYGVD